LIVGIESLPNLRIHDVKRTGFLTGENPLNLAKRALPVKHF